MPTFTLIAAKDFSYRTRRLKAGDAFEARNNADRRVLVGIGHATEAREPGRVEPPPASVTERARTAAPAKKPSTTATARKPGGSRPGRRTTRKSAAKKG